MKKILLGVYYWLTAIVPLLIIAVSLFGIEAEMQTEIVEKISFWIIVGYWAMFFLAAIAYTIYSARKDILAIKLRRGLDYEQYSDRLGEREDIDGIGVAENGTDEY